jgi:hypothetical protein
MEHEDVFVDPCESVRHMGIIAMQRFIVWKKRNLLSDLFIGIEESIKCLRECASCLLKMDQSELLKPRQTYQ